MKKPVRMKKLRIVLHKDKKEKVLRRLLEEGVFHLDKVETEGIAGKPKESEHAVDILALSAKLDNAVAAFSKMGIKIAEEDVGEKMGIKERDSEAIIENVKRRAETLEKVVKETYNRLVAIKEEREELESQKRILNVISSLNIDFKSVKEEYEKKYKYIFVSIGAVPTEDIDIVRSDIEKVTKHFALYSHPVSSEESLMLLLSLLEHKEEIEFILNLHSFKKLKIVEELKEFERVEDAIAEIEDKLSKMEQEEKELFSRAKEIAEKEKSGIFAMKELLDLEKKLAEVSSEFGRTIETYVVHGWVPSDEVYRICGIIREEADGLCNIESSSPAHGEKPPTFVSNPEPAKPLEVITQAYGIPDYQEHDPTAVVAITFPLIFGLMFGDVGQGAVIALIGYYIGFKSKMEEGAKKAARVVMLCGISAMIVGFLYGAVFSLEGVIHPLLFNPLELARENMPRLLQYALKLGIGMLSLAMIIHIANEVAHHKYAIAFVSKYGFAGLWLLLGGFVMMTKHGLDLIGIAKDIFIIPAIVLPLVIMIFGMWKYEGISLMVTFIESIFEGMIKFVVNTISFMRVAIIAIIHGALSLIMVDMMSIMPPGPKGMVGKAVIFVAANTIIIGMETFVSFIQTMRLHYYELFSKFFAGSGKLFKPLKFIRKHTVQK